MRTLRDHLRALFVVFHLVAITLMALPAPGGAMNRAAWADPTVQGEFAAWTSRINALGVAISQEELEDIYFFLFVQGPATFIEGIS